MRVILYKSSSFVYSARWPKQDRDRHVDRHTDRWDLGLPHHSHPALRILCEYTPLPSWFCFFPIIIYHTCITLLCYLFLIFRFLFRGSLPHSWGISALPKPRPHPPPRDPPSTPPNSRRWRPLPECPSPAQAEVRIIVIRWYKRVKDALQNYDEFSLREYSEVYLCMTKVYGVFFQWSVLSRCHGWCWLCQWYWSCSCNGLTKTKERQLWY